MRHRLCVVFNISTDTGRKDVFICYYASTEMPMPTEPITNPSLLIKNNSVLRQFLKQNNTYYNLI
jgi:hypothetical protein